MRNKALLLMLWIAIGVLGRIIPHWPDATPLTSLCLLSTAVFSKRLAILFGLITMIVADILLAFIFHYPPFGTWSLFTYSGFVGVILFGRYLNANSTFLKNIGFGLMAASGFWLWTNFGVWLLTDMYTKNLSGLWLCYLNAMPFLKYALLGTTIWMAVLRLGFVRFLQHSTHSLKTV